MVCFKSFDLLNFKFEYLYAFLHKLLAIVIYWVYSYCYHGI